MQVLRIFFVKSGKKEKEQKEKIILLGHGQKLEFYIGMDKDLLIRKRIPFSEPRTRIGRVRYVRRGRCGMGSKETSREVWAARCLASLRFFGWTGVRKSWKTA